MAKKKQVLSFILAFVLAFAMAFSVLFIVHEAEHDCPSDCDCHICHQIKICLDLLNNIIPDPSAVLLAFSVCFAIVFSIGLVKYNKSIITLVSLKVKLSI